MVNIYTYGGAYKPNSHVVASLSCPHRVVSCCQSFCHVYFVEDAVDEEPYETSHRSAARQQFVRDTAHPHQHRLYVSWDAKYTC